MLLSKKSFTALKKTMLFAARCWDYGTNWTMLKPWVVWVFSACGAFLTCVLH